MSMIQQPKGRTVHRIMIDVDEHGMLTLSAKPMMAGVIGMPATIQPVQIVAWLLKLASDIMQQLLAGKVFKDSEKQETNQTGSDGVRSS